MRWGIARLYSRTDVEFVNRVGEFVDRYNIARLALEDVTRTRRRQLARRRVRLAARYAERHRVDVHHVPHAQVLQHFGQEHHYDVALVISEAYPELRPRLPRRRRLWDSEDPRICLFKTIAIAAVAASVVA